MTTGVFRGEIYMTPLHSPGPKIGVGANREQLSFTGAEL